MKMKIDGELCTGHGRCWNVASEVYDADDSGFNSAAGGTIDVPEGLEKIAMHGLRSCPEGAISVVEEPTA
jgi:ferredoxin